MNARCGAYGKGGVDVTPTARPSRLRKSAKEHGKLYL